MNFKTSKCHCKAALRDIQCIIANLTEYNVNHLLNIYLYLSIQSCIYVWKFMYANFDESLCNEILQCSLRMYASFSKHTYGYTYTKKVFKLLHVENELLHRHLILNLVFQPKN